MKSQWVKLSATAVGAAALGTAVTVFVIEGTAVARLGADGAGVTIAAGERWTRGETGPTSFRAPAMVASAAEVSAAPEPELAALSKPELIALVSRLRDEKEELLRQRSVRKPTNDWPLPPTTGRYRSTPEELQELASRGTIRLRRPMLPIPEAVATDLRVSPQELDGIKAAVEASADRLHQGLLALYGEIGGDPALAGTLASSTLMGEIQNKSLKDEWAISLRQAAKERAGLVPAERNASPMLRAFRLEVAEDDKVLDALDQILGPARAEQFMNHESGGAGVSTFMAGP